MKESENIKLESSKRDLGQVGRMVMNTENINKRKGVTRWNY